ncbi:DUF5076 domain-containing protein [Henriciella pelagia]|jgi:hypothetical protein|uniref:DUF5076 domain-containing protein n=1 Tax=Henriciella pelagia TaxID=1977912 RepID=A0ABQ1J7S2_9PROT|nr:DUF5076 domain-containing protein [Henriciella pelagia]GGB59545.1 hypothetical protein GCM10011503_05020 [Henriciella pelagia]
MSDKHKALSKPDSIRDEADAQEFVRFWVSENNDHVSLLVGQAGDPKAEPAMWGFILADIAKHVIKIMREANPDGPSPNEIMQQILGGISERLRHAPILSGTTTKVET